MNKQNLKLLLIFLIVSISTAYTQTKNNDYEIYSLVFNDLHFGQNEEIDTLIIVKGRTTNNDSIEFWRFEKDPILSNRIEKDSVFEYNLKSIAKSIKPEDLFVNDTLISNKLYLKVLTLQEALKLKQKQKGTLKSEFFISISNIEYSGELALLTYTYYCGGRCAGSDAIIFEKKGNNWTKLIGINLWIA
ncbi:hypothetical protein [Winogradskyella sp.]|uniref:hypothetical protein n=1 Tax=Winogradskyella sp. TaxID=1883156 RepID=UPI001B190EB5|nr:hypothetical protein [Winogradskyella sp.]MBO6880156.1 hypothetical protein [Winogradskyella sp.]